MVADPRILARVAIRQGRIVAFARLDCGPDGVAEVTLVVAPDLRRQGLGREVLDRLLAAARERGLVRLQAMVDPQGQDAMLFFRTCGFQESGRLGDRVRFVQAVQPQFEPAPLEIEL
jgi:acetyltransferase